MIVLGISQTTLEFCQLSFQAGAFCTSLTAIVQRQLGNACLQLRDFLRLILHTLIVVFFFPGKFQCFLPLINQLLVSIDLFFQRFDTFLGFILDQILGVF